MKRGFTVVEILIALTIMVILLTLGVLSMDSLDKNARDKERESDIATIARGLERRYEEGNPVLANGDSLKGMYPGTNEALHMSGAERVGWDPETVPGGYFFENLPGTSHASIVSPIQNKDNLSEEGWRIICVSSCAPAGDTNQINAHFVDDNYVYEPVDRNGNICYSNDCSSFSLYWKSEVEDTIKVVKSKHR